ncbi:MAG: hypothetical protein HZA25_02665, partial [Candidatus Niyogibacteria bacterium]|nr:hypothetical protein [Candidatus Niyogibacteria bacterium]
VFFGEYLPYIFKIPAKLAGAGELVASFEARRNRVPGAEIKILRTAFGNIGVMICSEPLSPSIVRSLSAILTPDNQLISANMLFNINSEALFHGSRAYTAQNRAVLQMRAVENRRPIAQATNAGASFAVAAAGAIAEQASDTAKNTIIYAQIKPSDTLSFYTIFGDWIVLASAIVLICAAILIHKRRAK